jgi:hypothetical protein
LVQVGLVNLVDTRHLNTWLRRALPPVQVSCARARAHTHTQTHIRMTSQREREFSAPS